jgi:D-inositol-3-phosphate glycosyltransferase
VTLRVAMLSVHTCPLAAPGGKETGGMNVYVREVARELGRMGVRVDVFTRSQNPAIPRVVPLGPEARVIHLPAGPEAPMPREAVHRHLDEFAGRLEAFRRQEGTAYDLLHAHYWLSGVVGLALARSWQVPLVQMFHTLGRPKNAVARFRGEQEPELRVAEEERLARAADRIVAPCPVERAHLVWYYRARAERIRVIPCGVDTDLFHPMDREAAREALGLPLGPVLLYVGRLNPIKGIETLLEALPRLAEPAGQGPALLVIGGDVDEPENGHGAFLRARARALGLDGRVRFLGAQPQERLPLYYTAAEATVMPSYYESFGMVALEAMACGAPVVASRVGGLATTIQDGVTGYLVPEADAPALADRIRALLAEPALRARFGRAARRLAGHYRWPCVALRVCRLYTELRPGAGLHLGRGRCLEGAGLP